MSDVTIVVTTRDRPVWLAESLASIDAAARLVREDVRVLVVDDASLLDRQTAAVCDQAGVELLRLPHHVGTSLARVAGYERVDSPWFAFFDDDDVMLPNWFMEHLAIAPAYDVVSSAHWLCNSILAKQEFRRLVPATLAALRACHVTANDGSLIRHEAVADIPWRPDRENVMMLSMWLALAARGARFGMVQEPTWLYRWHADNQTPRTREDARDAAFRAEAVAEFSGVPV